MTDIAMFTSHIENTGWIIAATSRSSPEQKVSLVRMLDAVKANVLWLIVWFSGASLAHAEV